MAGRLIESVNRLIRSGLTNISEDASDPLAGDEKALVVVRHHLGQLIVQRRNLTRALKTPSPLVRELSVNAEMAVRKGREDLARAAFAEAARLSSGQQATVDEITGLDADIALLESAVAHLTGQRSLSAQDEIASLRLLLAELDRLDREPEGKGRRNPAT